VKRIDNPILIFTFILKRFGDIFGTTYLIWVLKSGLASELVLCEKVDGADGFRFLWDRFCN
jgi:hypothetical protein